MGGKPECEATKRWVKLGAGEGRLWIGCLHVKGKLTGEAFALSGRWPLTPKGQSLLSQQDPKCHSIRNTHGFTIAIERK